MHKHVYVCSADENEQNPLLRLSDEKVSIPFTLEKN